MTHSFDQQAHAEPAPITAPLRQQLPSGLPGEFAAHFGADIDDIGISSTSAAPAVTANGAGAGALTVGVDIAFGDTSYQPESGWGRELIVHELVHVVHQRASTGVPSDALAHLGGRPGPGYSIGRPPAVQRVLDDRSPGRPLEATLREELRRDFDFSEVRVHADDSAAALAAGVGADAFTRGTDIYFGAGLYQPNSSTGEKLLRHELTHVLQQANGEVSEFAGLVVPPEHPSEARVRPHSALGGRALAPGARDSRIQRQAIQRQPSVTGDLATDAPPASRSMTKDWVEKIRETLNYDVTGLEPSIEELQAFNRMADVDHDHEITLGELVNALDGTEKMTARAWFARAVFFRDYRMDRNLQKLSGEFDRNEIARRGLEEARNFDAHENSVQAGPDGNWINRAGRAATETELNRYRDPRRLLPLVEVAAAVTFPEVVAVTSAWDTGVKTEETITGKRSGVRVWDIMTGNIGVAGTEMTDSERAAAGTDAALGWASIGMDGMLAAMRRSPVHEIDSSQRASRAEALGRHFENSRGLRLSDDVTLFRSLPPEARLARNANPDLIGEAVLEGSVTPVAPTNPAAPGSERLAPALGPDYFSPGDYAVVPYEATVTSRSLQRVKGRVEAQEDVVGRRTESLAATEKKAATAAEKAKAARQATVAAENRADEARLAAEIAKARADELATTARNAIPDVRKMAQSASKKATQEADATGKRLNRAEVARETARKELLLSERRAHTAQLRVEKRAEESATSSAYLEKVKNSVANPEEAPRITPDDLVLDPKKRRPNESGFPEVVAPPVDRHKGLRTRADSYVGVFKEPVAPELAAEHDAVAKVLLDKESGQAERAAAGHAYEEILGRDIAKGDAPRVRHSAGDKERIGDVGIHETTVERSISDGKLDQLWRDLVERDVAIVTVPSLDERSGERLSKMAAIFAKLTGRRPLITVRETIP